MKVENITTNSDLEDNNEPSETIVINDNLTSSIKEDEILNKRKVVGLYDPEENGFDLEMWNNTEPNKIFELSKKINNMTLSEDAKNIYQVPLAYHSQGFDTQICRHFNLDEQKPDLKRWQSIAHDFENPEGKIYGNSSSTISS